MLQSLVRPSVHPATCLSSYRMEMDSPYWVCPPTVDLYFEAQVPAPPPSANGSAAGGNKDKDKAAAPVVKSGSRDVVASLAPADSAAAADPSNHATLALNASEPGSYPTRVMLYPLHTPVPDFRVFEVEAEVSGMGRPWPRGRVDLT